MAQKLIKNAFSISDGKISFDTVYKKDEQRLNQTITLDYSQPDNQLLCKITAEEKGDIFNVFKNENGQMKVVINATLLSEQMLANFNQDEIIDGKIERDINSLTVIDTNKEEDGIGRGFQLSLSGDIKIDAGARGVRMSNMDGALLGSIALDEPTSTFDITMTNTLISECASVNENVKLISHIAKNGKQQDYDFNSDISKFSNEFIYALAQTISLDENSRIGSAEFGNLKFLRMNTHGISDKSGKTAEHDLILIKNTKNNKNYIFHKGSFKEFDSIGGTYKGEKVTNLPFDFSIDFNMTKSKSPSISLPINLETNKTNNNFKRNSQGANQVKAIREFLKLKDETATRTDAIDVFGIAAVRGDTRPYEEISTDRINTTTSPLADNVVAETEAAPASEPVIEEQNQSAEFSEEVNEPNSEETAEQEKPLDKESKSKLDIKPAEEKPSASKPASKKSFDGKFTRAIAGFALIFAFLLIPAAVAVGGFFLPLAVGLAVGGVALQGASYILENSSFAGMQGSINSAKNKIKRRERVAKKILERERKIEVNNEKIEKLEKKLKETKLDEKERNRIKNKKNRLKKKNNNINFKNDKRIQNGSPRMIEELKKISQQKFIDDYKSNNKGEEPTQELIDEHNFNFIDNHSYAIARNLRVHQGMRSTRDAIAKMTAQEREAVDEANKKINETINDNIQNEDAEKILGRGATRYMKDNDKKMKKVFHRANSKYLIDNFDENQKVLSNYIDKLSQFENELAGIDETLENKDKLKAYADQKMQQLKKDNMDQNRYTKSIRAVNKKVKNKLNQTADVIKDKVSDVFTKANKNVEIINTETKPKTNTEEKVETIVETKPEVSTEGNVELQVEEKTETTNFEQKTETNATTNNNDVELGR